MRSNLQIKVGTYTGDGNDDRFLDLGVLYEPSFFLTKGAANNAHFRTRTMRGDISYAIAQTAVGAADVIQGFSNGGVVLGTNAGANAAATTYHYLSIRGVAGQSYFRSFRYYGSGGDDRTINTIGFPNTPDLVLVKGETTQGVPFKIAQMTGDTCGVIAGSTDQANTLQALVANGIQVGTGARANSNGVEYHGVAMKALNGVLATGTYIGTGAAQTISTDFPLDWIIIKNGGATTPAIFKTSSMGASDSYRLSATDVATNAITAFGASSGFTLGTSNDSNQSGNTFWWFGGRAGEFNVPIVRTAA